jgi:predicted TIM-barrel fold metal-dependent hydrolase
MTTKRLEGRAEPIIEPSLQIIDAHHHLFDRPALRYILEDYLADAGAGHDVVASVYVETQAFARAGGPALMRPLGEIEFANGVAAMCDSGVYGPRRVCAAIVGYADLRKGDDVARFLDRALEIAPDRFRGVRQIVIEHPSEEPFRYMTHRPEVGVLGHPGLKCAFRHLAARKLSFDAAVFHHQLPQIGQLADEFSDTAIVLNHMGIPCMMGLDAHVRADVFKNWRGLLRDLARRPNVSCKIGGLGLPFWGFGFDTRTDPLGYQELAGAWKPYVETAIDFFGVERCMMESNFPPDARSCGFVPLWNALKFSVKGLSPSEKAAVFRDTAARVYRINLTRAPEQA